MNKLLFLALLLMLSSAQAATGLLQQLGINDDDAPPPVEKVFHLSASLENDSTLQLHWKVLKGNYLYKDKLRLAITDNNDVKLGRYTLPAGEQKQDAAFGLVEVYHHDIDYTVPLNRSDRAQKLTLTAYFQGCSSTYRICYPPSQQTLSINLPAIHPQSTTAQKVTLAAPAKTNQQDSITQLLTKGAWLKIITVFFGLGILLSFTPCVLPMIPILSSIIIGQSKDISSRRAFGLSLTYVIGMASTYAILGVVSGLLGANLQALFQQPWIIISITALFTFFGLSMLGLYELSLPQFLQDKMQVFNQKQQGGKFFSVALIGILSALIVSPCLAPPLAGTLVFIGEQGDPLLGGIALFTLGLGMGVPLLIVGTSAGKLLPKAGSWMQTIKVLFGLLLLGMAIWILSRLVSNDISLLLWGLLAIISALFIGALDTLKQESSGLQRLFKALGITLLIIGSMLIIKAANSELHIWNSQTNNISAHQNDGLKFEQIDNLKQLQSALATTKKPVMLDFYADWCTDCKIMQNTTFKDPKVLSIASDFQLLKIDLTEQSLAHKKILQQLKVFGPPTIVFFNTHGREQSNTRLIGLVSANTLLSSLQATQ